MRWMAQAALFLAGMYVGMRAIAACYRVLDLWYTIRTAYPAVLRGLLGWSGMMAALAVLLGGRRTAFLGGALAYLLFYLGLYVLRPLVLRKPAPTE